MKQIGRENGPNMLRHALLRSTPNPKTPSMLSPPLIWKPSPRAKRLSLRIDIQRKAVVITLPPRASRKQGLALLHSQSRWVYQALADIPPSALEQRRILFKGRYYPLLPHQRNAALLTQEALLLGGETAEEQLSCLRIFLQKNAQETFPTLVKHYGAIMGDIPLKITLRDTRSRWGSCTRQKRLMLNWRLIMAPENVAHYVIIHELSHLRHFNHSPEFWEYVDHFCPNGKKGRINAEKWLRENGILLMRMV